VSDSASTEPLQPDIVDESDVSAHAVSEHDEPDVTQPTKLIRMAAMTRAMLEEAREAPPDEAGRRRLLQVHERSLEQLRSVLSSNLQDELDQIFLPLRDPEGTPSESEIRIAQAQLIGWLEGLFHGIQASLFSQQAAAQHQLAQMRQQGKPDGGRPNEGEGRDYPGVYL
jgi:hypothetical protein